MRAGSSDFQWPFPFASTSILLILASRGNTLRSILFACLLVFFFLFCLTTQNESTALLAPASLYIFKARNTQLLGYTQILEMRFLKADRM
jgi:galactitol-specific phosphotransferase system IIC component